MLRTDVIQVLTRACRKANALSVATMQATPVWHAIDPQAPLHIDMLGSMGSASSFALGLALGAPERSVVVVDGDGSLIMQLGALITIAHARAKNLTLIVMNNGLYETSGNQPVPGCELADFVALARAAGFPHAFRVTDVKELAHHAAAIGSRLGPVLLSLDVDRAEPCVNWPSLSMKEQIQTLRKCLN